MMLCLGVGLFFFSLFFPFFFVLFHFVLGISLETQALHSWARTFFSSDSHPVSLVLPLWAPSI